MLFAHDRFVIDEITDDFEDGANDFKDDFYIKSDTKRRLVRSQI